MPDSRPFVQVVNAGLGEWEAVRRAQGIDAEQLAELPVGWTAHAEVAVPLRHNGDTLTTMVNDTVVTYETYLLRLIQHPTGGWAITIGIRPSLHDGAMEAHPRFEDLYTAMTHQVTYALRFPRSDESGSVPAAMHMLQTFLLGHYDRDDPAEAAEHMLVALGANPRLLPAALIA